MSYSSLIILIVEQASNIIIDKIYYLMLAFKKWKTYF